jgi:hypothetical protein
MPLASPLTRSAMARTNMATAKVSRIATNPPSFTLSACRSMSANHSSALTAAIATQCDEARDLFHEGPKA